MKDSVLPVIDIREAKGKGREKLKEELYDAITNVGFLYLKGIEGIDKKELLDVTKWFFSLPMKNKMDITTKAFDSNVSQWYRGYFPIVANAVSHKEGFEMGALTYSNPPKDKRWVLCGKNQWPKGERKYGITPETFKVKMEKYYTILNDVGIELTRLICETMGADKDLFTYLFCPDQLTTLRLMHYPLRETSPPPEAIEGDTVIITGEHKDSPFLTMLYTFEYTGLQVRNEKNEWMDVPGKEDCFIVNIGQLLEIMSGGTLRATKHRVIDTGKDRFSVPFFMEPAATADITKRLPPPKIPLTPEEKEEREKDPPEDNYGEYSIREISKYAEYTIFRDLVANFG